MAALPGCGGDGSPRGSSPEVLRTEGQLARPPSAAAPRRDVTSNAPDTVRPVADVVDSVAFEAAPDSRVDAIVAGYRRHYRVAVDTSGTAVRGGADPVLVAEAKRLTAADFGYPGADGWTRLVDELAAEQRFELADGIQVVHQELAQVEGSPQ